MTTKQLLTHARPVKARTVNTSQKLKCSATMGKRAVSAALMHNAAPIITREPNLSVKMALGNSITIVP